MDASTARTLNIRAVVAAKGGPTEFANQTANGKWSQGQVSQWISVKKPKPIGGNLARELESELGFARGDFDRYPLPGLGGAPSAIPSSGLAAELEARMQTDPGLRALVQLILDDPQTPIPEAIRPSLTLMLRGLQDAVRQAAFPGHGPKARPVPPKKLRGMDRPE